VYVPDATVRHAVKRLTPGAALRDATRWAMCPRLIARHPAARVMLYRGVFWNVWHYLLLRSALSLLGPPWLRRLILARHAHALVRRARHLKAGPAGVPFLLVYDAIETATMIRASVRHRSVVL
jgi:hypothetical protein